MRLKILLLLLLPCSLIAQELSLEQDIAAQIIELQAESDKAMVAEDWSQRSKIEDRLYDLVTSSTVKPVNLEDQHGEVWNLGVLDQPFLVHGISNFNSGLNDRKIAAINTAADEYATQLMSFLLMPKPVTAIDSQRLASISPNVVVVFMDMVKMKDRPQGDTRLLTLFNAFPLTYYIRENRQIAGVWLGVQSGDTEEEIYRKNLDKLRKGISRLLRGKKIKRR